MNLFIIEHLEPKMWPWFRIEYEHIAQIVGRKNVFFTNPKSVLQLKPENACILDPKLLKYIKNIQGFLG